MTTALSTGRTVSLLFVHSSHDFVTRPKAGAMRAALDTDALMHGRRLSLCELSEVGYNGSTDPAIPDEKTYATLGQGVAICHPNDTFSKAAGRKHALGKAMKAAGLTYDERAELWTAYGMQFGWDK